MPSDSPVGLLGGPLFGQHSENFVCVQCKAGAQGFVCLMLKDEQSDEKPAIVVSYGVCSRCAALYWEEAGKAAMDSIRDSFRDS